MKNSQIYGASVSEGNNQYNESVVDLTLDQTITFTEVFFPPPSLTAFLTELGGSLGLWLGLGFIQLCTWSIKLIDKDIFCCQERQTHCIVNKELENAWNGLKSKHLIGQKL